MAVQTRMACAEYPFFPRQDALYSELWPRGNSNHSHCEAGALGVVVLFITVIFYVMCYFQSVNGTHFQGTRCHTDAFAIVQYLNK